MDEVLQHVRAARKQLEAKDQTRDGMLKAKRGVTSTAREVMNLTHQDHLKQARDAYGRTLEQVGSIREGLQDWPDLWHSGALRNALQEVAEAWALLQLVGEDVDLPDEAMTAEALVLGVADAVGELRRRALDDLIDERPEDAQARLNEMEALFEELRTIDVPSGVVDLKHKVDVAQTLVDKTRGKIALGRIEQRLSRLEETDTDASGRNRDDEG